MVESPPVGATETSPWAELAVPLFCPLGGCGWQPPEVDQLPPPSTAWRDALPPVVTALLAHLAAEAAWLRQERGGNSGQRREALAALEEQRRAIYAAANTLRAAAADRSDRERRERHLAALRRFPWMRPAQRPAGTGGAP